MADNEISNGEITLFLNSDKESELARKYLSDNEINFHTRLCSNVPSEFRAAVPLFANSFGEPMIPSLIVSYPRYICPFSYLSFSGVKSFIRDKLISKLNPKGDFNWRDVNYWEDVNTFYPDRNYEKGKGFSKERRKLVTCFDKHRERIFEGPIEESPHKLREPLETHDFKNWHEVSSWEIGELEELVNKQNRMGMAIDKGTRTVLFPEEIEALRSGKKIVIEDSRSMYQVIFESYFSDKGRIFGLYAHMLD